MIDVIGAILIGLFGGIAGGLLGVGGGIIFVPATVLILGTDQVVAQGASLVVIIATAATAVAQHRRNGTIDYQAAKWMIAPAVGLGLLGAFLAGEIGADALRRIFGVVAILVALRMAFTTWRARRVVEVPPPPAR